MTEVFISPCCHIDSINSSITRIMGNLPKQELISFLIAYMQNMAITEEFMAGRLEMFYEIYESNHN